MSKTVRSKKSLRDFFREVKRRSLGWPEGMVCVTQGKQK